jgi:hypothetical protein
MAGMREKIKPTDGTVQIAAGEVTESAVEWEPPVLKKLPAVEASQKMPSGMGPRDAAFMYS